MARAEGRVRLSSDRGNDSGQDGLGHEGKVRGRTGKHGMDKKDASGSEPSRVVLTGAERREEMPPGWCIYTHIYGFVSP